MIPVNRGVEPASLAVIRDAELRKLRLLGRLPTGDDISGYRVVSEHLWKAQHFKCCYCEQKIRRGFNDVEHYRPKGRADRRPGCDQTHGYWWLAFNWGNLLFACPACNRSAKNDLFPLGVGSISLQAEIAPPGGEYPLLLDPGSDVSPVEHIQFVLERIGSPTSPLHWWARPRNGSQFGQMTIDVCDLNNLELRELRADHFANTISPQIEALLYALDNSERNTVVRELARAYGLLRAPSPYACLSYDALRVSVPEQDLQDLVQKGWPEPTLVGL